MEDLIPALATLDRTLANHLEDYVLARRKHPHQRGTGTGKTTLLSILGKFIPQDDGSSSSRTQQRFTWPRRTSSGLKARREQNGLPAVAIRDLL